MNQSPPPTPSPQGGDDAEAMRSAVEDAAHHFLTRQAAQAEKAQKPGGSSSAIKWVLVSLLTVTLAWLWFLPPAALKPPPPLPITQEAAETSVRMDMFVQASRILNYQDEFGYLPPLAEEAGDPVQGVTYQLLTGTRFRLIGEGPRFSLTWDSDQSPELLLGDAQARVLEGAARASR